MYQLRALPLRGILRRKLYSHETYSFVSWVALFFAVFFLFGGDSAFAQEVSPFGRILGISVPDTRLIVLRVLQIIWILGVVAGLALAGYGFFVLRNAREEEDLLGEARGKRFLILGAIIAVASGLLVGIISFIYRGIEGSYSGNGKQFAPKDVSRPVFMGEYQSRLSRVEKHYPARDEKNIPRNAAILITFRDPIDSATVVNEEGKLRSSSIRIYQISPKPTPEGQGLNASASISTDGKTLTLRPDPILSEPEKKSLYGVILTSDIKLKSGDSLFGNTGGYSWQFEVSGTVDTVPPTVQSALPIAPTVAPKEVPRNALIQITFSEPIDPTAISGSKVVVTNTATNRIVEGSLVQGNEYRTLTFIPKEGCGTNSCNEAIYCLPSDSTVNVAVQSATLLEQRTPENPYRAKYPYDGIVDASGNSLDGGGEGGLGKNGKSEGKPSDNFVFSFNVGDNTEISAPTITSVLPSRDAVRVAPDAPVEVLFSRYMDSMSLHQGSLFLSTDVSYWVESEHDITTGRTRARIKHDPFRTDTLYQPEIRSEAHDIYQNCFNPCLGPLP